MYLDYFGLSSKPFELLPNPEFLFPSATHRKAMNYLSYGIQEGTGFILLTGEVGAGKTTLIKNLLASLGDHFSVSMVFNTRVTPEQLLALINEDFGMDSAGKDKVALLKELNHFLLDQLSKGRRVLLIVDEAQNLSPEALEEVRLLSNLESPHSRLLQTILVGQPELRKIIGRPAMRQLRQRIAVHYHLRHLTREEAEEYVRYRLKHAGNADAVDFGEGVFDRLFEHTEGVPRLINIACDFLLLTAFAEQTRHISLELITDVLENLGIAVTHDRAEKSPRSDDIARRVTFHEKFLHKMSLHYAGKFHALERRLEALENVLLAEGAEEGDGDGA